MSKTAGSHTSRMYLKVLEDDPIQNYVLLDGTFDKMRINTDFDLNGNVISDLDFTSGSTIDFHNDNVINGTGCFQQDLTVCNSILAVDLFSIFFEFVMSDMKKEMVTKTKSSVKN